MSRLIDLTGKQFGYWTVLYKAPSRSKHTYWHCRCKCGIEKDVSGDNLSSGKSQSCGCYSKEQASLRSIKDLTSQRFSHLIVLESTEKRDIDGTVVWKCQCDCGKICEVSTSALKDKHSCGCFSRVDSKKAQQSKINLIGQKFGKLTVISRDFITAKWKCQCECGNEVNITTNSLISSNGTRSCGKCNISKGEEKIAKLLLNNNIPFERQKTFSSCINPKTNRKLKFDFYVNNQYLIEYDGEQHFKEIPIFEELADVQYRDCLKTEWCYKNNIPLIRIPYTKLNTLKLEDIILLE